MFVIDHLHESLQNIPQIDKEKTESCQYVIGCTWKY